MTKSEVISIYSFLGNGIKMSALSSKETRDNILLLIRELRKAATGIFDELKVTEEPAIEGNAKEVQDKILAEPYEGTFTKIDEDTLLTAIAESKVDIPILTALNSFKELFKDEQNPQ